MTIEALFEIKRLLLSTSSVEETMRDALRLAAQIHATASVSTLLAGVLGSADAAEQLGSVVSAVDHVGFVAPRHDVADLSRSAAAAGFDSVHYRFPSMILARELGAQVGKELVPTIVLKACGATSEGKPLVVEVFMPEDADPTTVRRWIASSAGAHLGLQVRVGEGLRRARELLERNGFRTPDYMRDAPIANTNERVSALYFDGRVSDRAVRLEFCHYW